MGERGGGPLMAVAKSSDLGRRVGVAVVGIPLVMVALWAGGWVLGALIAVVAALTVHEVYRLARARGIRPFEEVGIAATAAVVLLATAYPTPSEAGPLAAGVIVLVLLLCLGGAVWLRWPGGEPMAAVGATVFGVVYVGLTLAFVPILRELHDGVGPAPDNRWHASAFVLLPLLATWAGDTAAYFAGRAWGRTKLAPEASPGKTVVGAVAGLVGSTVGAVLVAIWALSGPAAASLSPLAAAAVGAALGVAAQVGDLAESVLKREAGVKDSGHLLPGHGGFLDRIDALLFAFPVTWALLLVAGVVGGASP